MNVYSSPAAAEREKARRQAAIRHVFVRVVIGGGSRPVQGSAILAARLAARNPRKEPHA